MSGSPYSRNGPVRSRIEARVRRLEKDSERQFSGLDDDDPFCGLLECLSPFELKRGYNAMLAGDARLSDYESMMERAQARLAQGWTEEDRERLNKEDRDKGRAVREFMKALGQLRGGSNYLDTDRIDVVDLTEAEVLQLVEAARSATCRDDLTAVAQIVSRLRLDGYVPEMLVFEALLLRKELAPPPPKPDFDDFLRRVEAT